MTRSYTTVTEKREFPLVPHYAILTYRRTYVEGDARSREAPGHGYPGGYENTVVYTAYHSREAWEEELVNLEKLRTPYSAMTVDVVNVKICAEIEGGGIIE